MTRQKSFKRLVRARMDKTGESYTSARSALLGAQEPEADARSRCPTRRSGGAPAMAGSTGSTCSTSGAPASARTRRSRAGWREEQGTGGWNAQAVTVSYERARGGRAVGERADGFSVTASKTVAVPVERLYDAVVDERQRRSWLPEDELRERTATRPRSARFDWGDSGTRIVVGFEAKADGRSVVAMAHERLPDAGEAERMKAFWRERVAVLKEVLEA